MKKKLSTILLVLLTAFFLLTCITYFHRRNDLYSLAYQNIKNISTMLDGLNSDMEANSNDYSYSLRSLEVQYAQLNDILDELCYHPLLFPHRKPSEFNFYFINNTVHNNNQEMISAYCIIIEDLKNSLTDKNGNAKNFIFTNSYLDLYRKAESKLFTLVDGKG